MNRLTLLPMLGFLAACSEPEVTAPKPAEPIAHELAADPIQDALARIVPGIEDRAIAADLRSALKSVTNDPRAIEKILTRLEADSTYAADAAAIRLAITAR